MEQVYFEARPHISIYIYIYIYDYDYKADATWISKATYAEIGIAKRKELYRPTKAKSIKSDGGTPLLDHPGAAAIVLRRTDVTSRCVPRTIRPH